ncbi:MAG: sensor domain-containing diguanylate cyclase [Methylophilus sp.]|nr:sensor domain-containing diguanylate cyclase [Methylophilus sp.]
MQKPAIPPDEKTRIDTLRALNILDISPKERFDRITRLAKRVFGVPVALVSLIDADRQWFLSSYGLNLKETSRDISFCGHAILGDEIFTVQDAALDPRFNDNPLVTDAPNIRFYAGCPISVSNGSKLGTICLIDQSPREFDDEDKVLLRDLARLVEQEVAAIQLATIDELTKISNRRGFEVLSKHALSLCKRVNGTATLLFIDLDKFKPINDTFGHAEGDYALQVFSNVLRDVFRDSDVIGRIGGDEFAVLLTMTSANETEEMIHRLKTVISEYSKKASRGYNLEFSYGIAEFDSAKHDSINDLLAEADAKMYEQKKSRK